MAPPPPPSERALVDAGASAAARALSQLLHTPVTVHSVATGPLATIAAQHAPRALAVAFTVTGALAGRFVVITSEACARDIAADLAGAPRTGALGKRAIAALTELGNITASAFLNGVAALLETSCVPSVPAIELDGAEVVLRTALVGTSPGDAMYARLSRGDQTIDLVLAR